MFREQQIKLDTTAMHNKSDVALSIIRPGLEELGFRVEGGTHEPTIYRPVHFGEGGVPDRQYQIDSYHPEIRAGLEVEAGRSIRGNAIYRDIIQASLIVDLDYFVLAIPQRYRFSLKGKQKEQEDRPFEYGLTVLDAIYSSGRFRLPLKGLLFMGF
ncbi:MAG TPA: hypothetical protein VK763_04805 [Terriglobales bacterium]|nr:hypothetical protein [Terriglobales bacterium]